MHAYGQMAFEHFKADALTVLPYMGSDGWLGLAPWLSQGKAAFVVWCSSNKSGYAVQRYPRSLAEERAQLGAAQVDDLLTWLASYIYQEAKEHGSQLGLVLGATQISTLSSELSTRVLDLPLLVPGVGAQQGAVAGWSHFKRTPWQLWPVSRSLLRCEAGEGQKLESIFSKNIERFKSMLAL